MLIANRNCLFFLEETVHGQIPHILASAQRSYDPEQENGLSPVKDMDKTKLQNQNTK